MKLSEILEYRTLERRKIYCIETDEDLYVINGNFIKKANSEITKVFYEYLNHRREWRHVEKKVIDYFDVFSEKDRLIKETEFEIVNVYANDEKII